MAATIIMDETASAKFASLVKDENKLLMSSLDEKHDSLLKCLRETAKNAARDEDIAKTPQEAPAEPKALDFPPPKPASVSVNCVSTQTEYTMTYASQTENMLVSLAASSSNDTSGGGDAPEGTAEKTEKA